MKTLKTTFLIGAVAFLAATSFAQMAKPRAPKAAASTEARGTGKSGEELWRGVPVDPMHLGLVPAELTPIQLGTTNQMLLERAEPDGWGCEDDVPEDDWIKELTFWKLPLTPTVPAVIVEAGNTCGRSSENSPNAAMWIITFHGDQPVLLASPQESLNGALYGVLSVRTKGLPDLVVTWRVSDTESDLTYLRFDGMTYTAVLGAKRMESPNAPAKIVPSITPKE